MSDQAAKLVEQVLSLPADDQRAVRGPVLDRGEAAAGHRHERACRRMGATDPETDREARKRTDREDQSGDSERQRQDREENGEHPGHRSRPSTSGARRSMASPILSICG